MYVYRKKYIDYIVSENLPHFPQVKEKTLPHILKCNPKLNFNDFGKR